MQLYNRVTSIVLFSFAAFFVGFSILLFSKLICSEHNTHNKVTKGEIINKYSTQLEQVINESYADKKMYLNHKIRLDNVIDGGYIVDRSKIHNINNKINIGKYKDPYIINSNSKIEMIKAMLGVVGKVEYVWGGGHSGAGDIEGINIAWYKFNELHDGYIGSTTSEYPEHYNKISRCKSTSIEQYESLYKGAIDTVDKIRIEQSLSRLNFNSGINEQSLDGLDCSGLCSWLLNQATDDNKFNATARYIIDNDKVQELEFGESLQTGDLFAWHEHVVMIVAPYNNESRSYLTIEATPNIIRFGEAHYDDALQADIDGSIELAYQANYLVGGLDRDKYKVRSWNMDTVWKQDIDDEIELENYTVEDNSEITYEEAIVEDVESEQVECVSNNDSSVIEVIVEDDIDSNSELTYEEDIQRRESLDYHSVGRPNINWIVESIDTNIVDARTLLQYCIDNMDEYYLSGYNTYSGTLFNIERE